MKIIDTNAERAHKTKFFLFSWKLFVLKKILNVMTLFPCCPLIDEIYNLYLLTGILSFNYYPLYYIKCISIEQT